VSHGIAQLRATLRAEFDVIGVRLCEINKAIIPCVALFLVRLLPPLDNHGLLPNYLPPKWSIPKKKMAPRASVEGNPRSGAKLLNV